jgi:hypothetical protein
VKTFKVFLSESEQTVPDRYARFTQLPESHLEQSEAEGRYNYKGYMGQKARTVEVHPSKLRSTQSWIDKRWKPRWSKDSETPKGLMDSDGNVHLVDGHHRAEHAYVKGHDKFVVNVVDDKD